MALPKSHRLRHRRAFSAVYQSGLRRSTPNLTLRALPLFKSSPASADDHPAIAEPPSQFGVSISQKVSKKAVVRNRIKRQIRAALGQLLPRARPGWQVVVVVRPPAIECDYREFLQELEQLLISAEVINER